MRYLIVVLLLACASQQKVAEKKPEKVEILLTPVYMNGEAKEIK